MELIDRTALLKEIENKQKNDDKADLTDWILECIQKAPGIEITELSTEKNNPEQIQAGMTVYVITKHTISDRKTGTSYSEREIVKCFVEKVVKRSAITKYRLYGRFANGDYYSSTITEKAIGKNLFSDKESAEKLL